MNKYRVTNTETQATFCIFAMSLKHCVEKIQDKGTYNITREYVKSSNLKPKAHTIMKG